MVMTKMAPISRLIIVPVQIWHTCMNTSNIHFVILLKNIIWQEQGFIESLKIDVSFLLF